MITNRDREPHQYFIYSPDRDQKLDDVRWDLTRTILYCRCGGKVFFLIGCHFSCLVIAKKVWRFLLIGIHISKNIWTRSPGKFVLLLLYFFLLENRMCSCRILRKLSWKFWCVVVRIASPGKFICVLVPFLVLLEKMVCSYKIIMSSPEKSYVFLLHPSLLENVF